MKRNLSLIVTIMWSLSVAGCGLFDSSGGLRIDIPDQTFDFSLDADALVSQLETQLNVSLQGQDEIPAGVDVNQSFPVDVPPAPVDLSDNQDLKKYIDAGKVKGVTVKYVKVDVTSNTLNYDIPQVEVYLDNVDATAITSSSSLIGLTSEIPAGQTITGELSFTTDGRQLLSDYLLSLSFAFLARTEVTIDTSVSRLVPAGQLAGRITLGLYFTVDPL